MPKKPQPVILIATSSYDKMLVDPVVNELSKKGYRVVVYEADKVASGKTLFLVTISADGLHITYDGQDIAVKTICAAWYRRPNDFGEDIADKAKQMSLAEEYKGLQEGIWSLVPKSAWMNEPDTIHRAQLKVSQLVLAQSMGFTIPDTVVSNDWKPILGGLPDEIIMKMQRGCFFVGNQEKVLYTTHLRNHIDALPIKSVPFPGIFQPYLSKKREWRITVVGKKVFSAAIYTTAAAKDDWRKHQTTDNVVFKAETFPEVLQRKCIQYLETVGLIYGAFDFVEDDQGTIIFLELNPNGQYLWLEKRLGLPISQAIGLELARIAQTNLAATPID